MTEERKKESPYNYVYFVLHDDRVNAFMNGLTAGLTGMMEEGLVEEVKSLKARGLET